MSSATSIETAGSARVAPADSGRRGNRAAEGRDVLRPWHFFVLASLLAATAAVIVTRQSRPEALVVISLTIGAAGFAAAAFYRTFAPLVGSQLAPESSQLGESVRATLEREKTLVLRSIKELEFDRAMGKLSERDFEEMAGRLRSRAMVLMRQLDAGGGYQELIERELRARVRLPRRISDTAGGTSGTGAPMVAPVQQSGACACGTRNDADAAFCKRCGSRLTA